MWKIWNICLELLVIMSEAYNFQVLKIVLIKVSTAPVIYNLILHHKHIENQIFFLAYYLF